MNTLVGFGAMYAFGFGLCNGLTYMVPVHHGWLWYPQRPGLISGIIIGGFGFGALIFDNVATVLVNPDNLPAQDGKFPASVDEEVMYMMRVLVGCFGGLVIIAMILMFPGPKERGLVEGVDWEGDNTFQEVPRSTERTIEAPLEFEDNSSNTK